MKVTDERLAEIMAAAIAESTGGATPGDIGLRDMAAALQELGRYRAVAREVVGEMARLAAHAERNEATSPIEVMALIVWTDKLCALVEGFR